MCVRVYCIHVSECVYWMCESVYVCVCMCMLTCVIVYTPIRRFPFLQVYCMFTCDFRFRGIGCSHDGHTVLLTHPAQVCHRLHDHDVWCQLPPHDAESGISCSF